MTLFGALGGVSSLIPIFPYVGGGGYVPLQTMFSAIAPILLGGIGGIVAATVGGVIGMFIAPAAFPLQLVDVVLTGTLPALAIRLIMDANKRGWLTLAWIILVGIVGTVFPFYIPGSAAGFAAPANPVTYVLLVAFYWVITLGIMLSPLGRRLMPAWIRGQARKFKYIGVPL